MKKSNTIPFDFVLEKISPLSPSVRPMFGCYAVYVADKIVMFLRNKKDHQSDNGVWLATNKHHHPSLRKEFPSMRSITFLGKGPTNWQNIPSESDDFEESVTRACELVCKNDIRIGNIPKKRGRKGQPD